MSSLPTRVKLNSRQVRIMEEAFVSFMNFSPFYAYYFYEEMEVYYTVDPSIPTAATDGRRVFVNPLYFETLTPMERCFALAHEVDHVIDRDPQRMATYRRDGELRGLPYDSKIYNKAADYRINAGLIEAKIGTCNRDWLYDKRFHGNMLAEEVYEKIYRKGRGPGRGPGPGGQQPQGGSQPTDEEPNTTGSTYGDVTGRRGKPDPIARGNGGSFDEVLPPYKDPITGKDDLPDDLEFREAIAHAEAAAERAGKMPGNLKRRVQEILSPQVYWRDHLRFRIEGKVGQRRETWERPNRRRLVLHPFVYMPGKQGHGANLITVVVDNSGSISQKQLTVFFSEAASIINDCRPKRVQVIWCDWQVQRVEEARSLDELIHISVKGSPGGGGTSFRPPFQYLVDNHMKPDTLVFCTDMYPGDGWPDEPDYPVIWCSVSKGITPPWGELVEINAT